MNQLTSNIVYLGIDVHKRTYSVTARSNNMVIKKATMLAKPQAFIAFCEKFFPGAKIYSVYEAGFSGFHLHRILTKNGFDNIVVNPASIEVEARSRTKNDDRDSNKLSEQRSHGKLKSIYIPSEEREQMRLVSRAYETCLRHRHRIGCQLKALLHQFGMIDCLDKRKVSAKWIKEILALNFKPDLKWNVELLARQWLYFASCLKEIQTRLKRQASLDAELHEIYQSFDGVALLTARILANELGDLSQFKNEKELYSFTGLTPREYSSGDHVRLGHISHQGNPLIRKLLIESSWTAIQKDAALREKFQTLASRVGKKRAIVAIARKRIGEMRACLNKRKLNKIEEKELVLV